MTWKFVDHTGIYAIEDPDLEIFFGASRTELRKRLHYQPEKNAGRYETEDSYENLLGKEENWVRLSFENDELTAIEILEGVVLVGETEVEIYADLEETLAELEEGGYDFEPNDGGFTDFEHCIDLGDSFENGGEEHEICWFYTAVNFDHLQ